MVCVTQRLFFSWEYFLTTFWRPKETEKETFNFWTFLSFQTKGNQILKFTLLFSLENRLKRNCSRKWGKKRRWTVIQGMDVQSLKHQSSAGLVKKLWTIKRTATFVIPFIQLNGIETWTTVFFWGFLFFKDQAMKFCPWVIKEETDKRIFNCPAHDISYDPPSFFLKLYRKRYLRLESLELEKRKRQEQWEGRHLSSLFLYLHWQSKRQNTTVHKGEFEGRIYRLEDKSLTWLEAENFNFKKMRNHMLLGFITFGSWCR